MNRNITEYEAKDTVKFAAQLVTKITKVGRIWRFRKDGLLVWLERQEKIE